MRKIKGKMSGRQIKHLLNSLLYSLILPSALIYTFGQTDNKVESSIKTIKLLTKGFFLFDGIISIK